MPEIAINDSQGFRVVECDDLRDWLSNNARPKDGVIALDFEASGRHPDGNWATQAAKCEPEARVSIAAMAWEQYTVDTCGPCYGNMVGVSVSGAHHPECYGDAEVKYRDLVSVAIPFDQGMIGGKKGRYINKVTKKTPVLGWETLPHTQDCQSKWHDGTLPDGGCICAPWNFGWQAWEDLVMWWQSDKVRSIDYFNAKYDMWIAKAGLRDRAKIPCVVGTSDEPGCRGWQHVGGCHNEGVDLSDKLGMDVMLVEAIRDPAEKASLDNVARKFFGEHKDNGMDEGLKANGVGLGKRYDLVDWKIAAKYAAKDAELTYRAARHIENMRAAGEIRPTDFPIMDREHTKCAVLFRMEQRGVGFDVELCREQAEKMHTEVDKLVGELPFKDTNNAAADYFFTDAGLNLLPIKYTPGGAPSCDAEVVARLTHQPGTAGDVAKLWQHIANMKSVCSKWYDAWPERAGADGRLRTSFWQCSVESDRKDQTSGGAISGRLSATRVQLQGVPQDWRIPDGVVGIKQLFQAQPGHQVWSFDASNAEVRVTAWLTKCKALADVINSGVNIHSANTVHIFGKMLADTWPGEWPEGTPYDVFKRAEAPDCTTTDMAKALIDKDGDPVYVLSDHPEWKKYRTAMKRGIFGTIYASGVRTLKSQIDNDLKDDIPERQIKGFMDALNAAYPEIRRTSRACERQVDVANGGKGWVKLVSGRRRVFGSGERTYKALNACVQGGVAEMMSELMISVDNKWPGMLLNQVHDDLWIEIPDNRVGEVRQWVMAEGKRIFEDAFSTPTMPVAFKFDSKRLA